MTIHTALTLRKRNRRVDRKIKSADAVLNVMRDGCSLHLEYTKQGPRWVLSNGREVSITVAKLVTASASIVSVGDALFHDTPSQTWRWWSDAEEPAA